MFVEDEAITFWSGVVHPTPETLAAVYGLLGLGASEVFPIRWRTVYAPDPGLTTGIIEGFGHVGDDGARFVT